MQITTLMDNNALDQKGLVSEHGFSCLVEHEDTAIVFDTGATGAFLGNASVLGKDLSRTTHVVLSHGHYDHTGGVRSLVANFDTSRMDLWTGPGFFDQKYSMKDGQRVFKGSDFDRQFVESRFDHVRTVTSSSMMIAPGVFLIHNFNRIHQFETINPKFMVERDGRFGPDDFSDEVMLAIEGDSQVVLIVGCSHPGILNMVEHAIHLLGKPVYALLGGIHLSDASEERIIRVTDSLAAMHIEMLGISHCTGDAAAKRLRNMCPLFVENRAGVSLSFA